MGGMSRDELIAVVSDDGQDYVEVVRGLRGQRGAVILEGEFNIEQLEAAIELLKRAECG